MEERIKEMYNECWAIYKEYLENHDMAQYNRQKDELLGKYDGQPDITGLLWWWAGRINGLHEEYMRCKHELGR